jgi:hypothetical protein
LREFVVQVDGKSLVVCGGLRGKCGVLTPRFQALKNTPTF